jgi:hypothetical protein
VSKTQKGEKVMGLSELAKKVERFKTEAERSLQRSAEAARERAPGELLDLADRYASERGIDFGGALKLACAARPDLVSRAYGPPPKTAEQKAQEQAQAELDELAQKIAAERGIDYAEALRLAVEENPDLAKRVG